MSASEPKGSPRKTLGDLLKEQGLDDLSMPLDDPAVDAAIRRGLGEDPAITVPQNAKSDPSEPRSAEDQAVIDRVKEKQSARGGMPLWRVRPKRGGGQDVLPDHHDLELAQATTIEALGLSSPFAMTNLLRSLADAAMTNGFVDQTKFQALLSFVRSVEPRSDLEAMLAVEMAIVHDAVADMSRRLRLADGTLQRDSASNALNKLTRTFALLMDALKRHRSTGEQKMIIKRIEIREGGQAIVGSVGRDEAGRATIQANDHVEIHAAAEPTKRKPKAGPAAAALPPASDEERLAMPFPIDRPLHEVELEPKAGEVPVRRHQMPPRVNVAQSRWKRGRR